MSTNLKLSQKCARRARVTAAKDIPSTVLAQTGELGLIVEFINDAWVDIQNSNKLWRFMRGDSTVQTVAGTQSYSLSDHSITDHGAWDLEKFRCYVTATGTSDEQFLTYLDYDKFHDLYEYSTGRTTQSRPGFFTVDHNEAILLGQVPDKVYTIVGEYYKSASEMTLDADVPALPAEFHDAIMYRALMFYGVDQENAFIYQTAEREFNKLMNRAEINQLPDLMLAEPVQ